MKCRDFLQLGPHRALLRRGLEHAFEDVSPVARGLDLGCGQGPYRQLTTSKATFVVEFDREPRAEGVCVKGQAARLPFRMGVFQLLLATQVLEHVSDPGAVLAEAARVLEPGGWLVASVPQMVALHEEPDDYFRFTRYGIARLLQQNGFGDVKVRSLGGFWAMLAQQLEFHLLWDRGMRWRWARLLELFVGRALLSALVALDRRSPNERYALNLIVTARRAQTHR